MRDNTEVVTRCYVIGSSLHYKKKEAGKYCLPSGLQFSCPQNDFYLEGFLFSKNLRDRSNSAASVFSFGNVVRYSAARILLGSPSRA